MNAEDTIRSMFYGPESEATFGPRLLAYVDILGWKELVRSPRRDDVLNRIKGVTIRVQVAELMEAERKADFARIQLPFGHSIRSAYFSDTIVYSCEPTADEAAWLVSHVQRVCSGLLLDGHYTRGAVVVGDLHHDEGTVIGRALITAYDIERSVAKYPRIVVTDEAAPLLVGARLRPEHDLGPSQVRRDFDGLTYLDIFRVDGGSDRDEAVRADLLAAKEVVEADVGRTGEIGNVCEALNLQAKYHWMLRYLDQRLAEFPPAP